MVLIMGLPLRSSAEKRLERERERANISNGEWAGMAIMI